jgi:hypothetical protein
LLAIVKDFEDDNYLNKKIEFWNFEKNVLEQVVEIQETEEYSFRGFSYFGNFIILSDGVFTNLETLICKYVEFTK